MSEERPEAEAPYSWLDISPMQVGVRLPNVQWRLYALNEDQLRSLEKGANSISLGLLGLFGGVAFSALTTVMTVDLTDRLLAIFVGCLVASSGLTVWFGYQSWNDWKSMRDLTTRIRQDQHTR